MQFLQIFPVRTRTTVETIHPRAAHKFDKISIAVKILGEHYQVIASPVSSILILILFASSCHIHLTSEDGFERFLTLFLSSFVDRTDIVGEFLNAKHIAMVCNGHAFHAVSNGLVHQLRNLRHSV